MVTRNFPIRYSARQLKAFKALNNACYILNTRKKGNKRFVFPRRYKYWLNVAIKINQKKLN
jgi:hypothetical protein